MDKRDTDRLELLDRLADRVPELDLAQNETEWTTLDDGHEGLLVTVAGSMAATVPTSPTRATICTWSAAWVRSCRAVSAAS